MPDLKPTPRRPSSVPWAVICGATCIICGAVVVALSQAGIFGAAGRWWLCGGIFLLGIAGGCGFGLAVALRRTSERIEARLILLERQRQVPIAAPTPPEAASPPTESELERTRPPAQDAAQWDEALRLLRELREIAVLPEEEKKERLARWVEDDLFKVQSEIRYHVAEGNFTQAYEKAMEFAERRPDHPQAAALPAQVEASRRQHEARDVSQATQEVMDLISMSAWSQARQKVQQLQEQHPDSIEARQLMVRIEQEYRQAEEGQRRRMYAEVQRFVSRKRWEEALAAARTFVERFSGSDDAEAVRLQVPTLEANAEIEVRQRLEVQIMDLVKHGRYIEANGLARRVIEQYPDSPQADVLRAQLDRLEELANNPDAPPARIRIE